MPAEKGRQSTAMSIEWGRVRYECVTRPGGPKRTEPHAENRHRDGCEAHYPCGCVQRYYSSFYNTHHGFHFYSPSKTLLTARGDGFCVVHFKMRLHSMMGAEA